METKTALTIEDVIKTGPLGRTSIYAAIKTGQLTARKFGRRTFVLTADFDAFLNNLPKLGEQPGVAGHSLVAQSPLTGSHKPSERTTAGARNSGCVERSQMEKRMSKEPVNYHDKVPAEHENPWLAAAAEAGSDLGKLLKFVKGKWEIGDDAVPDGTEFVAYIDQVVRGWVCFKDSKVVDRIIGKIADGFRPPPREELPDTDQSKWEKDAKGEARDPWVLQWFLPMIAVETGDFVTFVTGSRGGAAALGHLCRIYGRKTHTGMLPIVALRTRSYKHHVYGRIETPDFTIVCWDDGRSGSPPAAVPSNQEGDHRECRLRRVDRRYRRSS